MEFWIPAGVSGSKRLAKAFEIEEMVRLGFLKADELEKQLKATGLSPQNHQTCLDDLAKASAELSATTREITALGTVETAIAAIRTRRIARVKEEREERRVRKAAERLARKEAIRRQRLEAPTFLGRGVSNRLAYNGGNSEKLGQLGLPSLTISAKSHLPSTLNPSICNGWCTNEETAR